MATRGGKPKMPMPTTTPTRMATASQTESPFFTWKSELLEAAVDVADTAASPLTVLTPSNYQKRMPHRKASCLRPAHCRSACARRHLRQVQAPDAPHSHGL